MAIQKITVNNFTVFKKMEIEFCSGINILIGENGTGKTHLLKLLYAAYLARVDNSFSLNSVFGDNFDFEATVTNVITDEVSIMKGIPRDVTIGSVHRAFFQSDDGKIEEAFFHLEDGSVEEAYFQAEEDSDSKASVVSHKPFEAVFIPVKDMLTHSKGLLAMSKKYSKEMPFDKTLLDIIEKASQWKVDNVPDLAKSILPLLEKEIDGKVLYEKDMFFVVKHRGKKVSFSLEAEGFKKLGLIWQLLMNESITKNTVLLWDEPDSNISPKLTPTIVKILLELSKHGVQIFIATHDYNLMKYFSMSRKNSDQVAFYSLFKTENGVAYEQGDDYDLLDRNPIVEANIKLVEDNIDGIY